MSELISFNNSPNRLSAGIKLNDGKKVLISITDNEVTLFKLGIGNIITGKIYLCDTQRFFTNLSMLVEVEEDTFLTILSDLVLECESLEQAKSLFNSVWPNQI